MQGLPAPNRSTMSSVEQSGPPGLPPRPVSVSEVGGEHVPTQGLTNAFGAPPKPPGRPGDDKATKKQRTRLRVKY